MLHRTNHLAAPRHSGLSAVLLHLREMKERDKQMVLIGLVKALITANPRAVGKRGWTRKIKKRAQEMLDELGLL